MITLTATFIINKARIILVLLFWWNIFFRPCIHVLVKVQCRYFLYLIAFAQINHIALPDGSGRIIQFNIVPLNFLRRLVAQSGKPAVRRGLETWLRPINTLFLYYILMMFWFSGNDECLRNLLVSDYTGTISVTNHGLICQDWIAQTPHSHEMSRRFSVSEHYNYCRKFSSDRPWCYTTDPYIVIDFCTYSICNGKYTCYLFT